MKSRALTADSFRAALVQDATVGENDATCDVVLQLSNVAGPVMAHQGTHGFLRNRFDRFVHRGCKLLNEIFYEFGNIGFPFAQGRQINRENIQPVVQIFAEFTILKPIASSLGWSQQPREHRLALCACCRLPRTHAPAQDAEQLGLKL